jgi:glutathione synthase/RimK-type ligase-like ATP-grasp enzyme
MKQIFLITDYQFRFGTKYNAVPYRSGMDKKILSEEFLKSDLHPVFIKASELMEKTSPIDSGIFLYTSSEDQGHQYKSFLEDVILSLTEMKATVIPRFIYMRAHDNKVIVELLRKQWGTTIGDTLNSSCFGSYEELVSHIDHLHFPIVIKRSEGFKSRGVYLAENAKELKKLAFKLSWCFNLKGFVKDAIRIWIHKGFIPESQNRRKFIIQEFVPQLKNDWKILVFGDKYYVLCRGMRKNDFRASGSGILSYPDEPPHILLDFAQKLFRYFDVPQISLDIAFIEDKCYLLEAQFLYFGTYTIQYSDFFFVNKNGKWVKIMEKSILEKEYVRSIVLYLEEKMLLS